ncbi:MAG: hypothetical protein ACO3JF_01970 [Ilumatobacteraceae bacterium]
MFLGDNLIVYLVLALGGALAVGNIAALVRPPDKEKMSDSKKDNEDNNDLQKAPVLRSLVMAIIGATAAVWAIASLVK